MQRGWGWGSGHHRGNFQYPRSDRRRCNPQRDIGHRGDVGAFSILGRIGGDATGVLPISAVPIPEAFSILGRIGGDATTIMATMPTGKDVAFSILGRIGGDATSEPAGACRRRRSLSVSSVGSEAMQLTTAGRPWQKLERLSVSSVGSEAMQRRPLSGAARTMRVFQYPRSDRRRCNLPQPIEPHPRQRTLSVSSVGSEAMQLYRVTSSSWGGAFLSVSSVGSEAMQHAVSCGSSQNNQSFQYPRSDRRRCNSSRASSPFFARFPSFSILGRIGGDAT